MGSLVIWVIHICWLASGPGGERFQWNLPYYFHISHFLPLVFKILPFTYFYHVYLRVGDIERAWLTRSVVSNTLIHLFTLGLSCSLPFYIVTCEYLCLDLSMVSLYISIHLHTIFFIYTDQWQGPVDLLGYCVWIP